MSSRKEQAFTRRQLANTVAKNRLHPTHFSNNEERKYRHDETLNHKPSYLMSYTKGLPHDRVTGLLANPDDFQLFLRAIDSGDFRDFRDTPLGHPDNCLGATCSNDDLDWQSNKALTGKDGGPVDVRAWESQSAGNAFELEGPDAQAVTMPPAPELGSEELLAEMAELYAQALLRDVPFNAFSNGVVDINTPDAVSNNNTLQGLQTEAGDVAKVKELTDILKELDWFKEAVNLRLNEQETARRRDFKQTPSSAFRGITEGDNVGPYLSQFLLAGNSGINGNDNERSPSDGMISYGAISVEQKVRVATPNTDYMTDWDEWLDVQNGADLRGLETYQQSPSARRRFIYTPRDLATYVHYDALYEAYLNACLLMLGMGVPFDPGVPFQQPDNRDHQQGFAHFGGPHILSLVTEVATRALKAVRFQKYNIHRRCRPEVLGARVHQEGLLGSMAPELTTMKEQLANTGILSRVATKNGSPDNYLLPMAFCEGSPMHPAYGAGHATVAAACVTILKAFFDHQHPLNVVPVSELGNQASALINTVAPGINPVSSNLAYVSTNNGQSLEVVPVLDGNGKLARLTVEGELNKLASNISIGRNWAGVHYFTDYYESILMGEKIALGILEEQKLTFTENFSMTVPLFNGETIRI